MIHQLEQYPHDVLSRSRDVPRRSVNRSVPHLACDDIVADRDVPLFALVRSTVGLPADDPRWWPERPQRRRREGPHPGLLAASTRHGDQGDCAVVPLVPLVSPVPPQIAHPSVALLERTLAALHAWDASMPVAVAPLPRGRHRLVADRPGAALAGA